jgi:cyclic beta-1,2-glucan synthetase
MTVRRRSARYEITVDNPSGVSRGVCFAEVDGAEVAERPVRVRIVDDGAVHRVLIRLG